MLTVHIPGRHWGMGWQWRSKEKLPPSALKIRDKNISSFLRGIKWFLEKQESQKILARS